VDHAVSALGGAVSYRRLPEGPQLLPLGLPALPLIVLDSGRAGDTAQMVAGVAARLPGVEPQLQAIGALVPQVRALLQQTRPDLPALGEALLHNQDLLRQIGVSTPELDQLVALALSAGALGAKLAGAGGGGVVLALCPEPDRLLQAARRAGVRAFSVELAAADPLGTGAQPP
jgi:mevalonate kinase